MGFLASILHWLVSFLGSLFIIVRLGQPVGPQLMKVTAAGDSSTGTYRPFGLDCTGLIDWSLRNAGLHSDGNWYIGTNLTEVSQAEAMPGDIALNDGATHVGIVVGRDGSGNLLVCHCSYGQNNVVVTEGSVNSFAQNGLQSLG